MARRKAEFQTLDPSTWPTVAWTEFDAAERESIRARTTAIEQYARGAPIKEIEQSTGVNRRQLYRLLERALTAHPDGRLCGFRALILHSRVADYVRLSPVKLNGDPVLPLRQCSRSPDGPRLVVVSITITTGSRFRDTPGRRMHGIRP
ncbi:hypothetical protein QZM77_23525 [Burkholderia cepacia]|nr:MULTISPECIES: hypothetical protein [Burkholderia cepacia complex]MCA8165517.1 hypothetical protein [Burkholderia cepacia]MDN7913220.1 hypothetical protein [Burkholderia cepacia]